MAGSGDAALVDTEDLVDPGHQLVVLVLVGAQTLDDPLQVVLDQPREAAVGLLPASERPPQVPRNRMQLLEVEDAAFDGGDECATGACPVR